MNDTVLQMKLLKTNPKLLEKGCIRLFVCALICMFFFLPFISFYFFPQKMHVTAVGVATGNCMTCMILTRCVCQPAGSVTSVHSQPCDSRALLQVPDISPVHPRSPLNLTLPRIPPPIPSPSPRSLRRQVRDPVPAALTPLSGPLC